MSAAAAIVLADAPLPDASSSQAKAQDPAAAGQRPSQVGYGKAPPAWSPIAPLEAHETARPTARHGLNAEKTLPKSALAGTSADPEDHVDERRGDVVGGTLDAREPCPDRDGEECNTDEPARCLGDRARHDGREDLAERPSRAVLELRPLPQCGQRNERDDENRGGCPAEQPGGDRKVAAAHQPVRNRGRREQRSRCQQGASEGERPFHGLTTSFAICVAVSSTSISKTPSMSALKAKTAGASGPASFMMS